MDTLQNMRAFSCVAEAGSFTAAAAMLDTTTANVSRAVSNLEAHLQTRLLNRTTRRISLTSEGEVYFTHAQRILSDIDEVERLVSSSRAAPKGLLRVNAPLGFGRSYVGPAIAGFVKEYAEVDVQLHLTDRPVSLPDDSIDISIHFGEMPDSRLIARKVAANRRVLVASPSYLRTAGMPHFPHDLTQHLCIVLRQNTGAYGHWRLSKGERSETVKVHGKLSTNDGEVALRWALEGHGILMRAEWDVAKYLRSGRLKQVLGDYETPPADIHAVFSERLNLSAKVSCFVDYLREYLGRHVDGPQPDDANW